MFQGASGTGHGYMAISVILGGFWDGSRVHGNLRDIRGLLGRVTDTWQSP